MKTDKIGNVHYVQWRQSPSAYYSVEDSRHIYLFDALLSLSGVGKATRALDFGCGNGDFITYWLGKNVKLALGYDVDAEATRIAQSVSQKAKNVRVYDSLKDVPIGLDVAFFVAVWMTLPDYETCVEILTTIRRHTKAGGKLFAAVTHPCFRGSKFKTQESQFELDSYFSSGAPFRVTIYGSGLDANVSFDDYHWTLTDMSRQLAAAGWTNMQLIEVPDRATGGVGSPDPSSGGGPPLWLIVTAENPV